MASPVREEPVGEAPLPTPPKGEGASSPLQRSLLVPEKAELQPGLKTSPARQVAHSLRVSLAKGGDRVTVHLEPESLGKVHVELVREPLGVAAHFRVESPQVQQALTGEVVLLRQALEAKGVALVQVQVDLDDGSDSSRTPWQRPSGSNRRSESEPSGIEGGEDLASRTRVWRPWGFETRI